MNLLFGLRFNLFDTIAYITTIVLIDAYKSYWWLLLLVPAMWFSIYMERKLAVNKVLNDLLSGK